MKLRGYLDCLVSSHKGVLHKLRLPGHIEVKTLLLGIGQKLSVIYTGCDFAGERVVCSPLLLQKMRY